MIAPLLSRRFSLLFSALAIVALPETTANASLRVEPGPLPLTLVSPAADVALAGGDTLEITWAPAPLVGDPFRFEEWEAFLSVDGGATWPIRLTPHLTAEIRSWRVRMPNIPSDRARLRLRAGDERVERDLDGPRLRILPGRDAFEPALPSLGRGEAARPGEAGVVRWVDAPRSGANPRRYRTVAADLRLSGWIPGAPARFPRAIPSPTPPDLSPPLADGFPGASPRLPPLLHPPLAPGAPPPADRPVLLRRLRE